MKLKNLNELCVKSLDESEFKFIDGNPRTIANIKPINIIIGANNSGKSRLLRTFFSSGFTAFNSKNGNIQATLEKLNPPQVQLGFSKKAVNPVFQQILKYLDKNRYSIFDSNLYDIIYKIIEEFQIQEKDFINHQDVIDIAENLLGEELWANIQSYQPSSEFDVEQVSKEYIPMLRGLRTLSTDVDVYLDRTLADYFPESGEQKKPKIFTGHSLYEDILHALLGTEEERESVRNYEAYLANHFFEGQQVTIIPKKDRVEISKPNNVVHVKIGSQPQRAIYELGDGIQAMIALTVRPFLEKESTIFFIEEPEQNLHAGMQRALIEAFRTCPQHMFFFTTQSNHFVDLTLEADDINLISVKKEVDDAGIARSIVESQANNNEILKDLGVLASSVLLANCSIWVEGVTDKRYLQVYLDKYLDELKAFCISDDGTPEERAAAKKRAGKLSTYNENLHYVFVEYQGSNITHWAFTDEVDPEKTSQTPAQRLSRDVLLIADADIDSKGSRVADLQEALDNRFELLEWKEIENYIPHDVLLDTARIRWDAFNQRKGCNIERFKNILINRFQDRVSGIGGILEYYVDKPPALERKFYEADSGTIKDKVKFCDAAVELMNKDDYEWELTPELKSLCDRIWSFIEECN